MTHTFLGSSPFDLKEWGMSRAQALGVPGWLMYMEVLQESWITQRCDRRILLPLLHPLKSPEARAPTSIHQPQRCLPHSGCAPAAPPSGSQVESPAAAGSAALSREGPSRPQSRCQWLSRSQNLRHREHSWMERKGSRAGHVPPPLKPQTLPNRKWLRMSNKYKLKGVTQEIMREDLLGKSQPPWRSRG